MNMGFTVVDSINRLTRTRKTIGKSDLAYYRTRIHVASTPAGFKLTYPNDPIRDSHRKFKEIARYELLSRLVEGKSVLDIGSGSFYGAAMMAERAFSVVGTEISKWVVNLARFTWRSVKNLTCRFVPDISKFTHGSFSAVTLVNVIEHLSPNEAENMLRQVAGDFLFEDGIVILATPRDRSKLVGYYENPDHKKEYSYDELLVLISRAGLKVEAKYFQTMREILPDMIDDVNPGERAWFIWVLKKTSHTIPRRFMASGNPF